MSANDHAFATALSAACVGFSAEQAELAVLYSHRLQVTASRVRVPCAGVRALPNINALRIFLLVSWSKGEALSQTQDKPSQVVLVPSQPVHRMTDDGIAFSHLAEQLFELGPMGVFPGLCCINSPGRSLVTTLSITLRQRRLRTAC
jgi:hypothetical protein